MVFDGKKLAEKIIENLKAETAGWAQKPSLAVVSFGLKGDNSSYVIQKRKTAESLGFGFAHYHYSGSPAKAREYLNKIAKSEKHTAVVVQMPLPPEISPSITNVIPVIKDPDLLSDKSAGLFFNGRSLVDPPTPAAILKIFHESGTELKNKIAVVFGYGRLIGRFLAPMLIKEGVLVSFLEKEAKLENILNLSSTADIIISASGSPLSVKAEMVKEGAVVVDAGFSLVDGKIKGDVDFDSVKDKVSLITPVPGGVGPVSVACLFLNVVKLFNKLKSKKNF